MSGESLVPRLSDQGAIRAHNLAAVARLVHTRGHCSRREIGETQRLNKATVSGLVAELVRRGVVEERDTEPTSGPGRPSRMLHIDSRRHASVVVELLGDRVLVSTWTLSLERTGLQTLEVAGGGRPAAVLRRLRTTLARTVSGLRTNGRDVVGIVVALPGLVNSLDGELVLSEPLDWQAVRVRAALSQQAELAGLPILVERVASLATVAEWRFAPDTTDLVCLHGGETGIGAGVVTGGRLLTGARGQAGELAFAARSQRPGEVDFAALVRRVTGTVALPKDKAAALSSWAESRRPGGPAELDRLAVTLGDRLTTLIALLDPEAVVLGGYLAPLADRLADPIRDRLGHSLAPRPLPEVAIRAGRHGAEAPMVGGAALLTDRVLDRIETGRAIG